MPKVTVMLEEREVTTLADLVEAEMDRGEAKQGAYSARSLVRLAIKVHELGKGRMGRWRVLEHAPTWVFTYLGRPLFPEVVSPATVALRRARARSERAAKVTRKRKPRRMLPAGAGVMPSPSE